MPRRTLARALVLSLAVVGACTPMASPAPPSRPTAAAAPTTDAAASDAAAAFVGVWGTSAESYLAASQGTAAVRLGADGNLENGALEGGRFVAIAPRGSASVPSRYAIEPTGPAAGVIRFALDGAEEQARYRVDGPDRFRTSSGPPDEVIVYYARRR